MSRYVVEEIRDEESFLGLEEEWNRLLVRAGHDIPFLRTEWLRLWWEHFGGAQKMSVILVRRDGELVLALPLTERETTSFGLRFRVLGSMTHEHSFRFGVIAAAPEGEAVDELLRYLEDRSERWDLVLLQQLSPEETAESSLIQEIEAHGYNRGVWPAPGSPYLPTTGLWDDYFGSLSRKFRATLRCRARRLEQRGPYRFEVYSDEVEALKMLRIGLEVEKSSWKGEAGSAIACDPTLTSFYTRFAEIAARKGWLRLTLLRVGDRYETFDYSLKYGNRWFCLKTGYDPDFAACSVGQLLAEQILKRCFAEDVVECNFMGLREWQPRYRRQAWVYVYNRGPIPWMSYAWKFPVRAQVRHLLDVLLPQP